MPCWQRRTQSLEVGTMNLEVLQAALSADAWYVSHVAQDSVVAVKGSYSLSYRKGTLTVSGRSKRAADELLATTRKSYTREAFELAAKRAGFTVATNRAGKQVATRRRYSR